VFVAILLGLLSASPRALAEPVIGFEQAMRYVQERNPDLRAARERIAQSWALVTRAWAELLPTASAQMRYTRNAVASEVASPRGTVTHQPLNQLDLVLALRAPVVVPWAYSARAAARSNVEVATADYHSEATSLLMAAAASFYTAAGADELVTARERALRVARSAHRLTEQRVETGTAGRADLARAEMELLRAEQRSIETEQARAVAYRSLGRLMQVNEPFRVSTTLPEGRAGVREDGVEKRAMDQRPDALALRWRLRVAELELESARWRSAPSLVTSAEFHEFNYSASSTNDRFFWKIDVLFEWQIFDGGVRSSTKATAQSTVRETRDRMKALEATIRMELENAEDALRASQEQVRLGSRELELAKEALDLVRAQYEIGVVSQIELLEAQDDLNTANVELAQARFRLAMAAVEWQRAAGTFPEK
jgi:outer membrane protein TolC